MTSPEFALHPSREQAVQNRTWVTESSVINRLFPFRVYDRHEGLADTARSLDRGRGVLVVFLPHPYIQDSVDVIRSLVARPDMRNCRILVPMAIHQHNAITDWAARLTGIDVRDVVTRRTQERQPGQYSRQDISILLRNLIEGMAETLDSGGLGMETLYADRQAALTPPDLKPVEFVVTRLKQIGVEDYGLLLARLAVGGRRQEPRIGVFHPFAETQLYFSPLYQIPDVMLHLEKGQSIDHWCFEQTVKL